MAESITIETKDFEVLKEPLAKAKANSLVLLDVDDTIITPISAMFAANSEHRSFIDDFKKDSSKYPNFGEMLETFRLMRKVKLINSDWGKLIDQSKDNGANVYALTQISGEKVGADSLKEWRYKELSSLGINFTENFDQTSDSVIIKAKKNDSALFHKGVFITGTNTKSIVLEQILQKIEPLEVIFVDDRREHVDDLAKVCKTKEIDYFGIHYTGAQGINAKINQAVIKLQKEYFTQQGKWLEDHDAYNLLELPNT